MGLIVWMAATYGFKALPVIFLGQFIYGLVHSPAASSIFFFIALGNTAAGAVVASFVKIYPRLSDPITSVGKFLHFLLPVFVGGLVNAAIGTLTLLLNQKIDPSNGLTFFLNWLIGDLGGILIMTPILFGWSKHQKELIPFNKKLEILAFIFIISSFVAIIFFAQSIFQTFSSVFILLPALLFCAFRLSTFSLGLVHLASYALVVLGLAKGFGRFTSTNHITESMEVLTYSIIVFLTGFITHIALQERNHLVETIALEKQKADEANQAKSLFLSSMSHELRTPLNAVMVFSQALERDHEFNTQQRDIVGEIRKAGKHLLQLINEILDLSAVEAGKIELSIEPVDLTDAINEVVNLLSALAAERNIQIHVQPETYFVLADKVRLKQVLLNLLSNAIKYNKPNGSVSIASHLDNEFVVIQLKDTGIGIDPALHGEVFKPFVRHHTNDSGIEGTGIGLSIVKNLVEAMDGTLYFNSKAGEGSSFFFTLPVTQSILGRDIKPESSGHTEQTAHEQQRLKIIGIDDSQVNLKLLEYTLKQSEGYDLLTADSAEHGLRLADQHQPDIIIVDINMPDMDGYEVLRRLRAQDKFKTTPIIALTASAMTDEIQRGLQAGFADYITKPFDIVELKKKLQRMKSTSQV